MAVGSNQPRQFRDIFKSVIPFTATVDFASAVDGNESSSDITVAGAALGDLVLVSPSIDVIDMGLTAQVTAAGVVTAQVWNNTGGTINLGAMTVKGVVLQFDSEVGVAGE